MPPSNQNEQTPGASAARVHALNLDDAGYPPLLRVIPDPPPILYVRGDPAMLSRPGLAIVGSRRASAAGLRLARDIAGEVARAGFTVCSGLAIGIDGAAHEGALQAGGESIAVMGTGIDYTHPKRHRALGERLVASGALVTEFEPGTPALPHNFPQRNRIISGLSLGVLVVEAALPSGSLITAHTALAQGREVFALPWSPLHPGGRGCLKLLRDGAQMVEGAGEILEALGAAWSAPAPEPDVSERPEGLLALVGLEPVSLDVLVQHASRPVTQLLVELSELELAGKVARVPGGYIRT